MYPGICNALRVIDFSLWMEGRTISMQKPRPLEQTFAKIGMEKKNYRIGLYGL